MSKQPPKQPDLFDVAERRDAAIEAVAEHAEEHAPGWADRAYLALERFCRQRKTPFVAEEARLWCYRSAGLDAPHDDRAWGAVMRRAERDLVLAQNGYAPAKSSNLSPKVQWVVR